jgi:hypothetical protein
VVLKHQLILLLLNYPIVVMNFLHQSNQMKHAYSSTPKQGQDDSFLLLIDQLINEAWLDCFLFFNFNKGQDKTF